MSGFRGKLRRAFAVHETEAAPVPGGGGGFLDALRRHQQRAARGRPRVELPEGRDLGEGEGACFLRRLEYGLDERHGALPLGLARDVAWPRLAELAKVDGLELPLSQCLFLDTETTGLSGGAGTLVFLCGLGFFEGERLVVEQVFLRAFQEEAAALAHVAARLHQRPWLVTYVGKSFDRHRIAARLAVHKLKAPVLTDQHLDLYYLARRAWGKRLPDVRLRTVEQHELGLQRTDDLPGAEAPWAFLSWIRDRSGPIDRVFEHNRLDVLSLVTLLGRLGQT